MMRSPPEFQVLVTAKLGSGRDRCLANAVRSQVTASDRDMSVMAVKTMEEVVDASEGQRKGVAVLLTFFAAVGLGLAVIGIYGVIAQSVTQRTRELGIRRALGAQQTDLLKMVLGQAFMLTGAGTLAGLAGAYALTRILRGLLFEVSATDPWTFAGVGTIFLFVAVAASYVLARRAMRVEPTAALRGGN
jgi:putative ABC transport system permease protein